jgi:steroid 5-alpha reductase family enzyme
MSPNRLWRDYGLSITLAVLFLIAWAIQTWTGWVEFVADQATSGQPANAFGADGYVWSWAQATFENWQSEFLQVFTFIVLTTFLVHRKSHESPDTDYENEAALRRIEAKVDAALAKEVESHG